MASKNHIETTLIFRVLGAPSRVRVLKAIDGQKTVLDVATELQMPYTYVSRILFDLASKGLLKSSTTGVHKRYLVSNFRLKEALESMLVEEEGEFPDVTNREDSTSGV
jgi:hypothetical protein